MAESEGLVRMVFGKADMDIMRLRTYMYEAEETNSAVCFSLFSQLHADFM